MKLKLKLNPHPASYIELIAGFLSLMLFICLVAWASAGCAQLAAVPEGSPNPDSAVLVPGKSQGEASKRVDKGWLPEYEAYIRANLPASLLAYEPTSFCPAFAKLDRKATWVKIWKAIAAAETGFNRLDFYYEHGIGSPDWVTGLHNVSEGLLQLSYGDSACKGVFDYAKDKTAFLDDYKRAKAVDDAKPGQGEVTSRHPERTILDPYLNLKCGMTIASKLVAAHPSERFADAMGHYWSTIRPAKGKVQGYFKGYAPECFK
jgi:hypothetical protein